MKANAGGGDGKDFENPEPGTHSAVCYKIVDVGTQPNTYEGKTTDARKAYIFWELSDRMTDGRRFSVFASYTLSMGSKANLRKLINNWKGINPTTKIFGLTDEEANEFEMQKLLGAPCIVKMVMGKNQKVYVAGGGDGAAHLEKKLQSAFPVITPENPIDFFSLEPGEYDEQTFHALPDWLKKKVMASPEYDLLKNGPPAPDPAALAPGEVPPTGATDPNDDIPF